MVGRITPGKRVATVFADEVLRELGKTEATLREEAVHGWQIVGRRGSATIEFPPKRCADYLRTQEPVFALVRQWCDASAVDRFDEVQALRVEVDRLGGLVERAIRELREAGHPALAANLARDLGVRVASEHPHAATW